MRSTSAIGIVWAASTIAGFWWYDGRYRLPVPSQPPQKPSVGKTLAEPGAKATLLAFFSPDCACSRFALPHIRKLQRDYAPAGLKVVVIVEEGQGAPEGLELRRDEPRSIAKAFGVPAAPGAVVLDAKGNVVYTGGFNVARFCDDPKTAFAEMAIIATLKGVPPPHARGEFYGCAMSAAG